MRIVKNLKVTPDPTSLPKLVTANQHLKSSRNVEEVRYEYRLAASHNIFFVASSGERVKRVRGRHQLWNETTPIAHRLRLVSDGAYDVVYLQIRKRVWDERGVVKRDTDVIVLR